MIVKISDKKLVWFIGTVALLWRALIFFFVMAFGTFLLYDYYDIKALGLKGAIPLGVLGTAVSLFLSFRNSAAYDRWWEARKIWGGIVNASRTFGIQVQNYVTQNGVKLEHKNNIEKLHTQLIYRHLAYINALRLALREQHDEYESELNELLEPAELSGILAKANKPTQINNNQAKAIRAIINDDLKDNFQVIEMMKTLEELYTLQGKCERIKNTPFPIYYDAFIRIFLFIFVAFLPLNLIGLFDEISQGIDYNIDWVMIPVAMIVSLMFEIIERVGSYTETPFNNQNQDIPMSALCRTIEIDLREMLDETDIPKPFEVEKVFGNGEILH
ncbi:MAG: putative membrane protein [Cognaticolwellia sp.]|jgi:putative membrane protein